jgi:hypothetical protein
MPVDPQRWNLYAYVRNNPVKFIDPKGEAIKSSKDNIEAVKKLQLMQKKLATAGKYLYCNYYKGMYFVGIYKNGPDGKGPDFANINKATENLARVIQNATVLKIEFAQEGQQVMRGKNVLHTMGSIDLKTGKGPGFTTPEGDGTITSYLSWRLIWTRESCPEK